MRKSFAEEVLRTSRDPTYQLLWIIKCDSVVGVIRDILEKYAWGSTLFGQAVYIMVTGNSKVNGSMSSLEGISGRELQMLHNWLENLPYPNDNVFTIDFSLTRHK